MLSDDSFLMFCELSFISGGHFFPPQLPKHSIRGCLCGTVRVLNTANQRANTVDAVDHTLQHAKLRTMRLGLHALNDANL